jgi:hypothetical protein
VTADVRSAIEELRAGFPGHEVLVTEEPQGGAHIIVDNLDIGPAFATAKSWVGFTLGFQHPLADVYPHYLRADLAYADGRPVQSPLNAGHTMPGFDRPAVMLSRRSNRWNPARDTAHLKLLRILDFLRSSA